MLISMPALQVPSLFHACCTGTKVQILRSKKDLSERIGESQVLSLLALLVQRYKYRRRCDGCGWNSAGVAATLGITRAPLRVDSQVKYALMARGDAVVPS